MASEEQYVVEKILKKRTRKGVAQYLIKWVGCDESENTWEPEQNLHCDVLLKQFLLEEKEAQSNKREGRRTTRSLPSENEQEQPVTSRGTEADEETLKHDKFLQQPKQKKEPQPPKRGRPTAKPLPSDNEQAIEYQVQVVSVEKRDNGDVYVTNEPKRRSGKRSLDSSQIQPTEDHGRKAAKNVEDPEEGKLKREKLSLQPSLEKEVEPRKRGRRSTKSLPSDNEQSMDVPGVPLMKVEETEDESKRKTIKRSSAELSQNHANEACDTKLEEKVEVANLEKKRKTTPRSKTTKKSPQAQPDENRNEEGSGPNGFARGYSVEHLVGITQEGDQFVFLVKWQETDETEMVPSSEVRKFVPEMMIDFYESRISWKQKDDNKQKAK